MKAWAGMDEGRSPHSRSHGPFFATEGPFARILLGAPPTGRGGAICRTVRATVWAKKMGVSVPVVLIRDQRRRWGSCDRKGGGAVDASGDFHSCL